MNMKLKEIVSMRTNLNSLGQFSKSKSLKAVWMRPLTGRKWSKSQGFFPQSASPMSTNSPFT